jgi:hypothetical protein
MKNVIMKRKKILIDEAFFLFCRYKFGIENVSNKRIEEEPFL